MVDISLDLCELGLRVLIVVLHSVDAAQNFGEIERLDGDALRLQNLFAVTHGVEGRGTRADGADAQVPESVHYAADGGEPLRSLANSAESGLRCAAW